MCDIVYQFAQTLSIVQQYLIYRQAPCSIVTADSGKRSKLPSQFPDLHWLPAQQDSFYRIILPGFTPPYASCDEIGKSWYFYPAREPLRVRKTCPGQTPKVQKMLLLSRRSSTHFYTLVLLALVANLATTRAIPYSKYTPSSTPASSHGPQRSSHNAHMAHDPRHLNARGRGDQIAHPNSLIHTMRKVPGSFRAIATVVPAKEAAAALEDFFMDIYQAIAEKWSHEPRRHAISYSGRGFTLAVTASGDTIPWESLAQLTLNAWNFAARGFTDLFDIMYASGDGKILVSVSLRMIGQAVGPGTGSGESSQTGLDGTEWGGTDWREGSVPSVGSGADAYGSR
ncbi:MAG: hypothetical protein Q9171_002429 [Xanthocarpia ochracea]